MSFTKAHVTGEIVKIMGPCARSASAVRPLYCYEHDAYFPIGEAHCCAVDRAVEDGFTMLDRLGLEVTER